MRGIDYSNWFLVKTWLTINPVKGILFSFLTIIFLNAYLLFLVERSLSYYILINCYEEEKQTY